MGNNAYKHRQRDKGLCTDCSESVIFPASRCEKHKKSMLLRSARNRKKRRDNNQCPECGAKLHPEMDQDMTYCITCRERIGRIK